MSIYEAASEQHILRFDLPSDRDGPLRQVKCSIQRVQAVDADIEMKQFL